MTLDRAVALWVKSVAHPPKWLRALGLVVLILLAWRITESRGLLIGLLAFLIYGAIFFPVAVAPSRVAAWSRRNPQLDGAIFGPVTFMGLAVITTLPLWVCLAVGVLGVIAGILLGRRRAKFLGPQ